MVGCKIWQSLVWLTCLLVFDIYFSKADEAPIVLISTGYIKGYYKYSNNGRRFRAFEGIPYAMPPTGKLRFEPPMPMFPWEGVALTNSFGSICMQYSPFPANPDHPVEGAEDCLYINVYSPERNNSTGLLPILFFIHGLGFQYSGGSLFGPKYLLDRDIILVTFNYRLGPLGFLSTGDATLPGNMGLKDQGLALRWISQNARAFGGDDSRITIVGQGAGAASVQYHYQSHWSKGYFQRGISASGTALNNWALTEGALEKAEKLADIVGCPKKSVITMVECMQHRPANQLVWAVGEFQLFPNQPFAPFGPVVEKGGRYPFIEYEPIIAFSERKAYDLPWITGVVSQEGLHHIAGFIKDGLILDTIKDKWEYLAPFILDFNYTVPVKQHSSIAKRVKEFYFGNEATAESIIERLVKMVSDRLYFTDAEKAVKIHARSYREPVWFYLFSYSGTQSFTEKTSGISRDFGVSHMDDMMYIFDTPYNNLNSTPMDHVMREKLIDIWVSFATAGIPNVGGKWDPLDPFEDNLHYLHIAGPYDIHMDHSLHLGESRFWESLNLNENKLYF